MAGSTRHRVCLRSWLRRAHKWVYQKSSHSLKLIFARFELVSAICFSAGTTAFARYHKITKRCLDIASQCRGNDTRNNQFVEPQDGSERDRKCLASLAKKYSDIWMRSISAALRMSRTEMAE